MGLVWGFFLRCDAINQWYFEEFGIYLKSQTFSLRSVPLEARMVSLWGDHWTCSKEKFKQKFKSEVWEAVTFTNTSFCTLKALQELTQISVNYIYLNIHTHTKKKDIFTTKVPPGTFPLKNPHVFPSANSSQGYWLLLILTRIAQIEPRDSFSSRHSSHMKRNHCNEA